MPEREHAWPIYDIFETAVASAFHRRRHEGHWQTFEGVDLADCWNQAYEPPPTAFWARSRIIPRVPK